MESFIIKFKANEAKEEILKKIDGALKKAEERENILERSDVKKNTELILKI